MIRPVLLASLLWSCACRAEEGASYFPLVEGSTWTYQDTRKANGKVQQWKTTMQNKRVTDAAGKEAVLLDEAQLAVKEDGVWATGVMAPQSKERVIVALKEPYKILPLRPKVGDQWQHRDERGATNATVLGSEKLKTPAGEFEAVKVYSVTVGGADGSQREENYRWYAAGVGLVKSVSTSEKVQGDRVTVEEFVRELVSYEIPKAGGVVVKGDERPAGGDDPVATLFAEGETLARKGDHAGAIAKYDAALGRDSRAAKLYAYKAVSLMAMKRFDAAGQAIDAAVRLNEKEHTYQEISGQLKVSQGKIEEGVKLYDRAASMSPGSAGAVYTDLAAVLAARNDPRLSGAIEKALKKAASADPPSTEALFALGQSYVNAGRAEGKDYLRRYIDVASRLPEGKRDETKIRLAKQLIRAVDAVKGL